MLCENNKGNLKYLVLVFFCEKYFLKKLNFFDIFKLFRYVNVKNKKYIILIKNILLYDHSVSTIMIANSKKIENRKIERSVSVDWLEKMDKKCLQRNGINLTNYLFLSTIFFSLSHGEK